MTDDEIFALSEVCGWGSAKKRKRQMTPEDATAWCNQMRAFAGMIRGKCASEVEDMAELVCQTGGAEDVSSSLRTASRMLLDAA